MSQRPHLLHLLGLFSLWISELERRFPLEPGSSDSLARTHTHKAKHRLRINTMLYSGTTGTVHRGKLMGNMNLTTPLSQSCIHSKQAKHATVDEMSFRLTENTKQEPNILIGSNKLIKTTETELKSSGPVSHKSKVKISTKQQLYKSSYQTLYALVKSSVGFIIRRDHSSQCQSSLKMAESYILPGQVYVSASTMFSRTNKAIPPHSLTPSPIKAFAVLRGNKSFKNTS